mmetsp:Transcript_4584/g.15080  ORF Transcript_4584/g.15080 Transcript_4584/m.15080 type:complete len:312 (-) Transcript_4584:1016-1951(-)
MLWQRGMRLLVILAPLMPAICATVSTSPFLTWLCATSLKASAPSSTRPEAVAERSVSALGATSTIEARPVLSTCVSVPSTCDSARAMSRSSAPPPTGGTPLPAVPSACADASGGAIPALPSPMAWRGGARPRSPSPKNSAISWLTSVSSLSRGSGVVPTRKARLPGQSPGAAGATRRRSWRASIQPFRHTGKLSSRMCWAKGLRVGFRTQQFEWGGLESPFFGAPAQAKQGDARLLPAKVQSPPQVRPFLHRALGRPNRNLPCAAQRRGASPRALGRVPRPRTPPPHNLQRGRVDLSGAAGHCCLRRLGAA